MRHMILSFLLFVSYSSFSQWTTSGTNIYNSNTGNVGIGTTAPGTKLEVRRDFAGETVAAVRNNTTSGSGSISARYDLYLGVTNAYHVSALHYGGGNPYYLMSVGSGVKAVYFDGPEFTWRNGTGATNFMKLTSSGSLGIGTVNTGSFKLAVEGKIAAREVRVTTTTPWPDYVFDNNYPLMPLGDVERFISMNKHLPGVPSANDVKEGIEIGKMNAVLLEKIEELTLHIIDLNKRIQQLEEKK